MCNETNRYFASLKFDFLCSIAAQHFERLLYLFLCSCTRLIAPSSFEPFRSRRVFKRWTMIVIRTGVAFIVVLCVVLVVVVEITTLAIDAMSTVERFSSFPF